MTVKDLIKKLKTMRPDVAVINLGQKQWLHLRLITSGTEGDGEPVVYMTFEQERPH